MEKIQTLILGAGPAGLSLAALLGQEGIPYLLVEKGGGVGSSWRKHYDRLHLHTVKSFSHLPLLPFPDSYPRYVPREFFVHYMEIYAEKFHIHPRFHTEVLEVRRNNNFWHVNTTEGQIEAEKIIVATGYNHTPLVPNWEGQKNFQGEILHSRDYKNGNSYRGKRVLIVGAGNTGAEAALDLFEYGAKPTICIRSPLRVVPRELFGVPTQISAILLNQIPLQIADLISQALLKATVPDLSEFGIVPPPYGSLRQVAEQEKIPLIDIGTIDLIQKGLISVVPGIKRFLEKEVEFENGKVLPFDAVILATGYTSALSRLFPDEKQLFDKKGNPIKKGEEINSGLYFAGFNNHITGFLYHIGKEAEKIAYDIKEKIGIKK